MIWPRPATVHLTVKAAAMLDAVPHPEIHNLPVDQKPYWHIERARIGDSREVPVELIVNGQAVARKTLLADGAMRDISFDVPIEKEQLGGPADFGLFAHQPHLRGRRRKAHPRLARQRRVVPGRRQPVLDAKGAARLRKLELPDAIKAYDHAREVYRKRVEECAVGQ